MGQVMKRCIECGEIISGKPFGNYCQRCYRYLKDGGVIHSIPPKGVIERDERGYMICHICGRAYKRIGSHARESHQMTAEEYKEEFGLCRNAKMTEKAYSDHMRELAYTYDMPKRLIKTGKNTRLKPGNKLRKGKKVRLQEMLDKRARKHKERNIQIKKEGL